METKEVKLSDGRVVVVKEVTALEDTLGYQLIAPVYDEKKPQAAGILHRSLMVLLSIVSVDDEPFDTPTSLDDVYAALGSFKRLDWGSIQLAYDDLNSPTKDILGE